jgi:phosphoribosylformylglycinamidine synthase
MAMTRETLTQYLAEAFPDAEITLTALVADDNHWQAEIVSPQFSGKSRIAQHQMVYKALKGKVGDDGDELHALALKTRAPG